MFIFYSCIISLLSPPNPLFDLEKKGQICVLSSRVSCTGGAARSSREERDINKDRQKYHCEMFCLLPITPCTFDPSPLLSSDISTQMPTNMASMGKHELRRMPRVT